ncbi:MAG: glycosyltransferase family 39 protein [Chloroflexota bacterium]
MLRRVFTGWGALWLLAAAILLLAAPMLTYPLGRDQGEFAIIGSGILQGAVPYVDLWNPKPPAVFYTYAAAIQTMGHNVMALRALDLILFLPMAAALYGIGKRLESAAVGLWAVALYGVFYFTETFWTLTQNDGIAAVPMALAVWCVFILLDTPRDEQNGRRYTLAGMCGALCALSLWFKYPYLFFIVALVVGYLLARRAFVIGEVIAFCGGGLMVGLGGMAYLASIGAFEAWITSATVTAGYTAQGYDLATFRDDMLRYGVFRLRQWHVLWVLAGAKVLLFYTKPAEIHTDSGNRTVTERSKWRIIMLWLMGTAVAMLVQAKGYDYHWLPMLPPLALLGAGATDWALRAVGHNVPNTHGWISRLTTITIALVLATLLAARTWGTALPYLTGRTPITEYHAHFIGGEFVADESLHVSQYLREHTTPNDTLYIWGFRPEIYYMSDLRPASRFIFQFPLVAEWYPPEWQQQNVDTLWASLPPYVVVVQGDFMPWVTGVDADSNTLLQSYTELNNWLIFNYERDTQIGNFLIWRRKASTQ